MRLKDRVATVTGSGRGMGEAIIRALAREGAKVVVNDINGDAAEAVAKSIRDAGGEAIAMRVDVRKEEDAEAMVKAALDTFGRLDIHVNNAGISTTKTFLETTREDVERIAAVNMVGAFLCAQAAVRAMLPNRYGRIINISSLSCQRGGVGRVAYGMAKAGLEMMTRVMSVELAASGITINNIAPGAIDTEMAKQNHDAATREAYVYLIPQRRYGLPEEVADAAVFLASDEARYVHGHTLNVDGGFLTAGLMFKMPGIDSPPPPKV